MVTSLPVFPDSTRKPRASAAGTSPEPSVVDARVRSAVDDHYDAVWRFLRRLGVPEADVEDAAQRVLLVLARRLDQVTPGTERSFLLGSALRVASEVRRARGRQREVSWQEEEEALTSRPDPAPGADEQVHARRMRRLLDRVLDELPDDLRAVMVLVDLEEQTMNEASAVLGIPQGTVASRLRRAREVFEEAAARVKRTLDEKENGR